MKGILQVPNSNFGSWVVIEAVWDTAPTVVRDVSQTEVSLDVLLHGAASEDQDEGGKSWVEVKEVVAGNQQHKLSLVVITLV